MKQSSGLVKTFLQDNLDFLQQTRDERYDLIYVDPPFNTGKVQLRKTDAGVASYEDSYEDFLGHIQPRMSEAYRVLKPHGALFVHLDYREVHYVKVLLDSIFGRAGFLNEIIWAYDYGARSKKRWPTKHDTILCYVKNPKRYTFNYEEMDRIPYMAPGLVGPEKATKGKTPTDVWWHTIVPTNGKEKTGYPTQKPVGLLSRIVKVHSNPGDSLLDFYAGSGTFGEAGASLGRHVDLVDVNDEALTVMSKRLQRFVATS